MISSEKHLFCGLSNKSSPTVICKALTCKVLLLSLLFIQPCTAGPREQAKRLHDRLSGVPANNAVISQMANDISTGNALTAAYQAMQHPAFYSVTVKNLATPWTNVDFDPFASLNDYSATIIGMVRDDKDFRLILSANTMYTGNVNHPSLTGIPGYSTTNNNHYEAIEQSNADLSDNNVLIESTQTSVIGTPAQGAAGVMTSRAAAKAFFIDGTNRAMFRYTLLNHLCYDMEQVKDATRASDRIRQDISRSPGGDSRLFLNNCVACHSGMDPMAQSFAYYDYINTDSEGSDGFLQYTAGVVDQKYFNNDSTFPYGYKTPDDQWSNYWRQGPNAAELGWDSSLPGSGSGAASMGQELAHSEAFAQCQVKKVFKQVCLRDAGEADRNVFDDIVSNFKSSGYQLKRIYADSAIHCMGD